MYFLLLILCVFGPFKFLTYKKKMSRGRDRSKRHHSNSINNSQSIGTPKGSPQLTKLSDASLSPNSSESEMCRLRKYSKIFESVSSDVGMMTDCFMRVRVTDIATSRFSEDVQKVDMAVDHWAEVADILLQNWERYFSFDRQDVLSFSSIINIPIFKSNFFGSKSQLLKRSTMSEGSEGPSQKKRRVNNRAKNVVGRVAKPLQGIQEDKPLPLMEHMKRILNVLLGQSSGSVDYFKLVINPHSYTSTVYNIFTVSFLVREGLVFLSEGKDGTPVVEITEEERIDGGTKHHFVFNVTLEEWKRLIKSLNIKSPMVRPQKGESTTTEDNNFYEVFTQTQRKFQHQKNDRRSTESIGSQS